MVVPHGVVKVGLCPSQCLNTTFYLRSVNCFIDDLHVGILSFLFGCLSLDFITIFIEFIHPVLNDSLAKVDVVEIVCANPKLYVFFRIGQVKK